MTTKEFLGLLQNVKKNSNGWMAHCPAHDDKQNSLSIKEGSNRRIVVYCHAGCSFNSICNALSIDSSELAPQSKTSTENQSKFYQEKQISNVYDYKDEKGELLYQVVRHEPKDFRQRKPDGNGGWLWKLGDVRRVPYRLPELIAVNKSEAVFIVEGEKDVDRLYPLGLIATCNVGGAGKWRDDYNEHLRGRDVVIIPDNDETGKNHAQSIAASLHGIASSVKVVELSGVKEKGDVSDWLDAGNTKNDLLSLVETLQLWTPNINETKNESALRVVCMADVEAKEVSWLWYPYIPLGKLTLLDGEEGIGKSWLLCAIVGRITRGELLPFASEAVQGNVLMLSGSEDGLADTIKPRLLSVGADCTKVFAVDEPFTFDEKGLIKLAELIATYKPSLVIIDPLFDYITAKTDINTDNQSRAVTKPLREIAERFDCAVVAVRHIGKAKGNGEARAAGLGGIGFRAAGRSGLLVGCDPQDRTKRAMVLTKSNLADVNAAKAVGFTIENNEFRWLAESNLTAERILARLENEEEREEQNEAAAFLREVLRDGKKPAQDIKREAEKHGLSEKRLRTARRRLDVKIEREGFGQGSKVYWFLPSILAHENSIDAIDAQENNAGKYDKYDETRAGMETESDEREVLTI